mgnify:CR=1 FL=1
MIGKVHRISSELPKSTDISGYSEDPRTILKYRIQCAIYETNLSHIS